MSDVSKGLIRALLLLLAGALGWVMICVGPRLLLHKLPYELDVSSRWLSIGCMAFAASGAFLFAFVAGRCFPLANRRLVSSCEVIPWIGLGFTVIGGVLEW